MSFYFWFVLQTHDREFQRWTDLVDLTKESGGKYNGSSPVVICQRFWTIPFLEGA